MRRLIRHLSAAGLLALLLNAACGYSGEGVNRTALYRLLVLAASCESAHSTSVSRLFRNYSQMMYLGDRVQSTENMKRRVWLECMLKARDCESYLACKVAGLDMLQACGEIPGPRACHQDALVLCDMSGLTPPVYFDCATAGLVCGQGSAGAECGMGTCDPALDEPVCDGSLILECDPFSGVTTVQDCWHETAGGVCNMDFGFPECTGSGPECNGLDFESRCEGTELVSCLRGRENRIDCKEWHPFMICRNINSLYQNGQVCAYEHDECDPFFGDSCSDGAIVFCADGRYERLDCRKYGFTDCVTKSNGPIDTVTYCIP